MSKIKILILRFSSIGDIVLTSPVVRCLKNQLPGVEIHYGTKSKYQKLLDANPYIHQCHFLEDSLPQFVKKLKAEKFDYIVDLHNNLRTFLIKSQLNIPAFSFKKLNYKKWLYVNFKLDLMPDFHIVDRYLATLAPFGVQNDGQGLDYFIPEKDELSDYHLPEDLRNGFVAYAIGGGQNTKRLPVKKIIELCDSVSEPILLLGDAQDAIVAREIMEHYKQQNVQAAYSFPSSGNPAFKKIYDACGKYNINQSASLVKKANYVISHDTGLMHIAAAFKKRIYSIWGNTTPAFGMYPYQTEFKVIENKEANCRPCSKIGHKACPYGHFKCMNELNFDLQISEVKSEIISDLATSSKSS
ncbi:MAG: glycosyltransferase family 9 protein [Bacteroidota bacterium]